MAWSLCRPPTTWGKHNTIRTHTHTHTWHESPSKANLSMDRLSPPSCGAPAVIDNSILSHPPSRLVHVVHLQLVQTDRRRRMTAIKYRRILFFMFSNEKQGSVMCCAQICLAVLWMHDFETWEERHTIKSCWLVFEGAFTGITTEPWSPLYHFIQANIFNS